MATNGAPEAVVALVLFGSVVAASFAVRLVAHAARSLWRGLRKR
jgi:hypothetical protein